MQTEDTNISIEVTFHIANFDAYDNPKYTLDIGKATKSPKLDVGFKLSLDLSEQAVIKLAWECCKAIAFKDRMEEWEKPIMDKVSNEGEAMINAAIKQVRKQPHKEWEQKPSMIKKVFLKCLDIIGKRRC
jgi:hypothetical protein